MSTRLKHFIAPLFLLASFTTSLHAASFSTIYSFGDSLSDAGNDYIASGGTIPASPPYSNGRFTNGNVWVQDLSASLGLGAVTPSLAGGNDYAYGGAQTGTLGTFYTAEAGDLIGGPDSQISQFQTAHPTADPNALYTIWIGANDLDAILKGGGTTTNVAQAVGNVDAAIAALTTEGAKDFLILTVPDLGKTPAVTVFGPAAVAAASGLSALYDTELFGSLSAFSTDSISVLDTYSLLDEIVANPSAAGLTDVTDPCLNTVTQSVCSTPNSYLFWDELHPTAAGHAIVADAALNVLTPEPATYGLIALGLGGICFLRRRKV